MSIVAVVTLVTAGAGFGLVVGWLLRGDEQKAQRAADDRARSDTTAAPVADTWTWPLAKPDAPDRQDDAA